MSIEPTLAGRIRKPFVTVEITLSPKNLQMLDDWRKSDTGELSRDAAAVSLLRAVLDILAPRAQA